MPLRIVDAIHAKGRSRRSQRTNVRPTNVRPRLMSVGAAVKAVAKEKRAFKMSTCQSHQLTVVRYCNCNPRRVHR